jgi:hypothetical protein
MRSPVATLCPPRSRTPSHVRTRAAMLLLASLGILLPGCIVSRSRYEKAQAETVRLESERNEARDEVLEVRRELLRKEEQILSLQSLGPRRLDLLYQVARIELGDYTSGVNLDERPGDDGVRVYLRPIDQTGSPLKAAGSIRIQLFDLAAPPAENLLGEYEWTVEDAAGHWSSFVLHHYTLTCPWKHAPPRHEEVTVRAEFLDYLTGKRFTRQMTCKLRLAEAQAPQ